MHSEIDQLHQAVAGANGVVSRLVEECRRRGIRPIVPVLTKELCGLLPSPNGEAKYLVLGRLVRINNRYTLFLPERVVSGWLVRPGLLQPGNSLERPYRIASLKDLDESELVFCLEEDEQPPVLSAAIPNSQLSVRFLPAQSAEIMAFMTGQDPRAHYPLSLSY